MRLVKNGLLIFGSDVTVYALTLLRNVLLARLLTVEQFGVASTFSILLTLVEVAQNAGINRMIIQAPDADEEHVQNTLHLVALLIGMAATLLIVAFSYPYALAMGMPELTWAYLLVALIPTLRGFAHLDPQRFQRHHRFGPSTVRQVVPQVAATLSIWPLFLLLHDFRVILGSIFLIQTLTVAASHYGAERPFRFAFDRSVVMRALHFGMPLMLNGILMFLVFNGDRMIVTNRFGAEVLGGFSSAFMLMLTGSILVNNTILSLMLPRLSQAENHAQLQRTYDMTGNAMMLIMGAVVAGTAFLGPFVLTLLFGAKYAPAAGFMLPLAIMQAVRMTRVAPDIVAMAKAQTRIPLYANIVRVLAFPVSYLFAVWTGDIYWMIATGICGELIASLFSTFLTRKLIGLSSRQFLVTLSGLIVLCGAIYGVNQAWLPWWTLVPAISLFLFAIRDLLFNYKALLRT